jgi:ankyrin repeat protein
MLRLVFVLLSMGATDLPQADQMVRAAARERLEMAVAKDDGLQKEKKAISTAPASELPQRFKRIIKIANDYYYKSDYDRSFGWYLLAALNGDPMGEANVGYAYMNGEGVPNNDSYAVYWNRAADAHGNVWGTANLALMHEKGRGGLPRSIADARILYAKAAAAEVAYARERLKFIDEPPSKRLLTAIEEQSKEAVLQAIADGADVNQIADNGSTPLTLSVASDEVVAILLQAGASVNLKSSTGATALGAACEAGNVNVAKRLLVAHATQSTDDDGFTPLTRAIQAKSPALVRLLIEYGADVETRSPNGAAPLHWAVREGASGEGLEILRLLIEALSNIDAVEEHHVTPLMLSLDEPDRLPATNLLIAAGADVNIPDFHGNTPLIVAAFAGNREALRVLLKAGATVDKQNTAGMTALIAAAGAGHIDVVQILLRAGASKALSDSNGNVALNWAVSNSHNEVAAVLADGPAIAEAKREFEVFRAAAEGDSKRLNKLATSADANRRAIDGATPLMLAAVASHPECVRRLLALGANPDAAASDEHVTPLMVAAATQTGDTVRVLLAAHATTAAADAHGRTALAYAIARHNDEALDALLAAAGSPLIKDDGNPSPLQLACMSQNWSAARKLIAAGVPDPSGCGVILAAIEGSVERLRVALSSRPKTSGALEFGISAQHIAAARGAQDLIEALATAGADLNVIDREGNTPIAVAAQKGHWPAVLLLAEYGADISCDVPGIFGNSESVLHLAAESADANIVEAVIAAGAYVDRRDSRDETPLHRAASRFNVAAVQALLKAGADVNAADSTHDTPLTRACAAATNSGGDATSTALLLIHAGADVNQASSFGCTPFLYAAMAENLPLLKLLDENGATLNVADLTQQTPLFAAAEKGNEPIVDYLISRHVDLNVVEHDGMFGDRTPLLAAINGKHEAVALALMRAGADASFVKADGRPLLYFAALDGQRLVLASLIANGADVNAPSPDGETPLMVAAQFGGPETVTALLKAGADIHHRDNHGRTALLASAGDDNYADVKIFKLLLAAGADIHDHDDVGNTALHLAAEAARVDAVKYFITAGADVNAVDEHSRTPLLAAVTARRHGYPEPYDAERVVSLLLAAKARVDAPDANGVTPLIACARKGYDNLVRVLLSNHADPNHVTATGSTPLEEVMEAVDEEMASLDPIPRLTPKAQDLIISLLIRAGANVNPKDPSGNTPLTRAAFRGKTVLAGRIIKAGGNLDAQNNSGWSALMYAASHGDAATARLLVDAGANTHLRNGSGKTACDVATDDLRALVCR